MCPVNYMTLAGLVALFAHAFSTPHARKSWFNHTCCCAIPRYRGNTYTSTLKLLIIMIFVYFCPEFSHIYHIQLTQILLTLTHHFHCFIFHALLSCNDTTAVTSVSKADIFLLKIYLKFLLWMICDIFHLLILFFAFSMPVVRILKNNACFALSGPEASEDL